MRIKIVKLVARILGVWFECPNCGWEQPDTEAQREPAGRETA